VYIQHAHQKGNHRNGMFWVSVDSPTQHVYHFIYGFVMYVSIICSRWFSFCCCSFPCTEPLDSLELTWTHLNSLELTWTHLNSIELTWTHLNSLELNWTHLNSFEFIWIQLNSLELTWTHLNSFELTWIHLNSLELTWTHLNSSELTWTHLNSLELTWIHLNSLELIWIHLNSLELTRESGKPAGRKRETEGVATDILISFSLGIQTARTHACTARHETISRFSSLPSSGFL